MTYNRLRNNPIERNSRALNCGSFALGVDEWFLPYANQKEEDPDYNYIYDEIDSRLEDGEDLDEVYAELLELDSDNIQILCPWCYRITEQEAEERDSNVVAYRIAIELCSNEDRSCFDYDFHFRLKTKDGWYEKLGSGNIKKCDKFDTLYFKNAWDTGTGIIYDSPIIYFAIKD